MGRRLRIIKRAVRREARGLAGIGIEHLEHQRFVARHLRKIKPLMRGMVGDVVDLALVALLCEGHILFEDVPGIGKTTLAKALARRGIGLSG